MKLAATGRTVRPEDTSIAGPCPSSGASDKTNWSEILINSVSDSSGDSVCKLRLLKGALLLLAIFGQIRTKLAVYERRMKVKIEF
jgi:hypothetical protein